MKGLKGKIYQVLEKPSSDSKLHTFINIFLISLILLNGFFTLIETVDEIYYKYGYYFKIFEFFSIIIFSIEYVLRLWTCTVNKTFSSPIKGRIKFAFRPLVLIDLLSVLPFYLPFVINMDLRNLRLLRILRLIRILKLVRYFRAFKMLAKVFKESKEELVITFFIGAFLLITSSTVIYYLEHNVQPKAFSSIPATMWWGVVTLTTVGYGDIYPITTLGKIFGAITSIIGIGTFTLPAGIIAAGFVEEVQKENNKKICPHCGKKINS